MGLKTLGFRVPMLASRVKVTIEPGSWRGGKTTAERGYGGKWQVARAAYLRLHPFCVVCDEEDGLTIEATVVDHKIPHRGNMELFWNRENWQSMCKPHHDGHKQRLEQG